MFEAGKFYTHRNMLDACFRVRNVYNFTKLFRLRVDWFLKSGMDLGQRDSVLINVKDLKNWSEIEVPV